MVEQSSDNKIEPKELLEEGIETANETPASSPAPEVVVEEGDKDKKEEKKEMEDEKSNIGELSSPDITTSASATPAEGTPSAEVNNSSFPVTHAPGSSSFGNALQTWTEIDLPSLQKRLDDQGIELKEDQKSSLLNRKELATKTKEFKKLLDEDKLSSFKTLLKSYQNEIDSLTTKKKTVENYFFGIYRLIAEAPDPRPLLEVSLDAVMEFLESEKLKKEISKLGEELLKRADYDQLKQRLIRNEQKLAEFLQSQLKAKDEEFQALIEEKESNWNEQQKSLERQISDSRHKIEELRTSNEVTNLQLNSHSKASGGGSDSAASASVLAELEIVSRDAESSKKRVFELEKRNEKLRTELTKAQSGSTVDQLKESFSKKVSELEGENALLIANVEQTKRKLDELTKQQKNHVDTYNSKVQSLTQEVTKLKQKIDKTSDYDELKHEINLLKQIQFGGDDEATTTAEEESGSAGIDSIIIQRNKTLTKELADFRSQHDSLVSRISDLEKELNSTSEDLVKTQLLNDRLENDLADLQDAGGSSVIGGSSSGGARFDSMSMISGVTNMTKGVTVSARGSGGRNGSIIGSTIGGSGVMDDSSILPIITKQRDRFRDRNNELEDELKKQYSTISDLKRQMNSIKKDNEELYERTRYLALFKNNNNNNDKISFSSRGVNRKLLEPKANVEQTTFDNPYQASYESKLHPIEQFRMREQERINSKLSPIERLFISFSRAILATRTTRMLFVGYCFGLHMIVMVVTIYAMGLSTLMIPEVGMNSSTGGIANKVAGAPDTLAKVMENNI